MHLAALASLQALHWNNFKQIIQIELNRVKNPNRQEASQLAIYKHDRGVEFETAEKQIQIANFLSTDVRVAFPYTFNTESRG